MIKVNLFTIIVAETIFLGLSIWGSHIRHTTGQMQSVSRATLVAFMTAFNVMFFSNMS